MWSWLIIVFAGSLLLTMVLERISWKLQWVDLPSERKFHEHPTPRFGGISFVVVPLLVSLFMDLGLPGFLVISLGLIFFGGLLDDVLSSNSAITKMLFQLAGCVVFCVGVEQSVVSALGFGDIAGRFLIAWWLLFLVNATNLMDNMNGLSSGLALVAFAFLLLQAGSVAEGEWLGLAIALEIACVMGFFLRNFPNAKIFMGDQGSQVLGFLLGVCFIYLIPQSFHSSWGEWTGLRTTLVAWIFFLPFVYDVSSVVAIRLREKRPLYVGDKCHLSHRLVNRGNSPVRAVLWIVLFQFVSSLVVKLWIDLS